ncbi:MAG TPA: hypothetical protein VNA14_04160 [Mycobacteriales bacterium]|nr:hypothetical protein [Mycobacteriales bacterium]
MIRRALLATAVAFGLAAAVAMPAHAEPGQICLVYSNDRSGICVEIGRAGR